MTWLLVIVLIFILLLLWLLLAPLQLEIDTRQPSANIKWVSVGRATVWYDEEWWLSCRVFFFHRTIKVASMKAKRKKLTNHTSKKTKKKSKGLLKKMIRVLRSCRVQQWWLAVDTGDYTFNAWLCPFNFFGKLHGHLLVNFTDQNYFYIRVRNRPVRMLYAFLR